MEHSDFTIGLYFYTSTGKWLCTDVGTRTICAIKIITTTDYLETCPPYSVVEYVFDEDSILGCSPEPF